MKHSVQNFGSTNLLFDEDCDAYQPYDPYEEDELYVDDPSSYDDVLYNDDLPPRHRDPRDFLPLLLDVIELRFLELTNRMKRSISGYFVIPS